MSVVKCRVNLCGGRMCFYFVITPGTLWHEGIAESQERPVTHGSGQETPSRKGKDLLPEKIVTRYMMKEEDTDSFLRENSQSMRGGRILRRKAQNISGKYEE